MKLIDCRAVREQILNEAKENMKSITDEITLVVIQVEGDSASDVYIRNKKKTCEEIGIRCLHISYPNDIDFETLADKIQSISNDFTVDGVMLQLPLPEHLKPHEQQLLDLIPWYKDVDGLSTESIGRLWSGQECLVPCTAQGVMRLLPDDLSGKEVCVIGRSNLVGKPLIKLLEERNATVTLCHSKTFYLRTNIEMADIVISAIGKPKFFNGYCANDFQTWIDVGINRDENGKLCGDVNIDTFENVNCEITPVPNGVGLLTTACLILNVIKAHKLFWRSQRDVYGN